MATLFHPHHSTFRLDRAAMTLSGLCLVHCVATTIFVAMLASVGSVLGSPLIHEVGLTIAMAIGALALGKGILDHGFMMPSAVGGLGLGVMAGALSLPEGGASEVLYTMTGVLIVALGHRLNGIAGE
ncbi:MAG: MerC domain-containing protein [Sphingomicrobium sp.]